MPTENEKTLTNPWDVANAHSLLKRTGFEYLQDIQDSVWTDYNTHDPGVTILDVLNYVVT